MMHHQQAHAALMRLRNAQRAEASARFFKTGPGQYAQGDCFLGVAVPEVRRLAHSCRSLPLAECTALLQSPWNEVRLLALLCMNALYARGNADQQTAVFDAFCAARHRVNNWNLVDSSAHCIVGAHLLERERAWLYTLAQSDSLWDRRIAIIATLAFIRQNDFADTLQLSAQLLRDQHDLMHKACGWMLREVAKRDPATLHTFLQQHVSHMPRTMLRYSIERFTPQERARYMARPARGQNL